MNLQVVFLTEDMEEFGWEWNPHCAETVDGLRPWWKMLRRTLFDPTFSNVPLFSQKSQKTSFKRIKKSVK